jgi:hypothetical protein
VSDSPASAADRATADLQLELLPDYCCNVTNYNARTKHMLQPALFPDCHFSNTCCNQHFFQPAISSPLYLRAKICLPLCTHHFQQCATVRCALAVVLWYHTRLISESLPAQFPSGRIKKHFLPLPSSAVTSQTDVIL